MPGLIEILQALLLGIIEGMTEFLPVSSTGHLIILDWLMGFDDPGGTFKVMIQLGAIFAIVIVYFRKILSIITGLPTDPAARRLAIGIVLAFLPAAFAGVLLHDWITLVLFESPGVVGASLLIGGFVMLAAERFRPEPDTPTMDDIPIWKSFLIGCCQTLALIPGVSRSGATIVGAMLLKVERRAAAEFSFFLAMPTMLGAFVYDAYKNRDLLDFSQAINIGIGLVAAFIAGFIVVKMFLTIVSRYGFAPFAYYRIVVGAALLIAVNFFGA